LTVGAWTLKVTTPKLLEGIDQGFAQREKQRHRNKSEGSHFLGCRVAGRGWWPNDKRRLETQKK
jgi:hypothetical protein